MGCCSGLQRSSVVSTAWMWGATSAANNTGIRYMTSTPGGALTTVLAVAQQQVIVTQTVTSIRVSVGIATATSTITFTFQVNGIDTAIITTLDPGETSKLATGFSVPLAIGDRISLKAVQSIAEINANSGYLATVY